MSQQDPIRLFIAHTWEESDDYTRIFEYLESARNFYYRNMSTPEHRPAADVESRHEDLRAQIRLAEILIAPASLYRHQSEWLMFMLHFAKSCKKPVLVVRPFGVQAIVPRALTELADDVVDWEERGLVDAIRRLARQENTARYDVIEFNPDDFKLED